MSKNILKGETESTKAVPAFVGVAKEPKPCAATLPPPVLKVPAGFCSPKEDCPKPKVLAPLFPNRLLEPGEERSRHMKFSGIAKWGFVSFAQWFQFGFLYGKADVKLTQHVSRGENKIRFAISFRYCFSLPVWAGCPNPPGEAEVPNGFLLAASSLGLPPRPLKNPPAGDEAAVLAELEPNRLPPDDGCCCCYGESSVTFCNACRRMEQI